MFAVVSLIAPLFVVIGLASLTRLGIPTTGRLTAPLNWYALTIGLPVILFLSLATTPVNWQEAQALVLLNSLYFLAVFSLTILIGRMIGVRAKTLRTLAICLGLGNVAYLGIPILSRVYGSEILSELAVVVAVYLVWVFTVGVGYLEWSSSKRRLSLRGLAISLGTNPILLAVLAGVGVSLVGWTLPDSLSSVLGMVGQSVTPVVLIVVGLTIGGASLGKWREWLAVLAFSSLVLVVFPLLYWLAIRQLPTAGFFTEVSILSAAMPLAITPFALADRYRLDRLFIARAIVLSTALSAVTVPVWVWVLG